MDVLGDELMSSIEKPKPPPSIPPPNLHSSPAPKSSNHSSRPLPGLPPTGNRNVSMSSLDSYDPSDDPPPMVPCRTNERLELIDAASTYDTPSMVVSGARKTDFNAVDMAVITPKALSPAVNYEETIPCEFLTLKTLFLKLAVLCIDTAVFVIKSIRLLR